MSRTHHATCAYRLSCGCIAEYNSFPSAGRKNLVLCGSCGESSSISYRYPDDMTSCHVTCRADNPRTGGNTRVRCSEDKAHKGDHYDASVGIAFRVPGRLASGRTGTT